jgi:integrase
MCYLEIEVNMAERLTKRIVEGVLPATYDVVIWDAELKGFGLKVTPAGRRVYFLYYRTGSGQQRRPTIGTHGEVTAEEARQIAKRWLAEIAFGRDVGGERSQSKLDPHVVDLAARYLTDYAEVHKKPRSVATDRANIENHVLPLIGKLLVKEVKRSDVDKLHLAVRDGKTARRLDARARGRRVIRGGPGIANRVVALLSKMFACAESWGLREGNPARGIKKFREKRKDRFLNEAEIARLLDTLVLAEIQRSENPFAIAALRLLLFTGMRVGEVTSLRWSSFDRQRQALVLPDSKTGSRVIPLSSHALEAINRLGVGSADDPIFPGASGATQLALTRPWYRLRASAGIDATANLHSLRHTFASWSVMGGLSLAQVGAVLGHKTAQTTLRYADHRLDAVRSYGQQVGDVFARMRTAAER